ncbi:MAG TPA: hypothetical protein VG317_22605 [Pseudonocardiaceae bacterium]|jgi:hypothetical protein|nr:hypothetical protein [Pseudonocardiaceae bacterium]
MITATESAHADLPDGLHGAYTVQRARAMFHGQLRSRVDRGELVGFGRGVLLDGDRADELRTRCAGALLLAGPSSVVVGPTAAALYGCTVPGGFPVHLKVPYERRVRSRDGLIVHQGYLNEDDIQLYDGMRVACLEWAITDVLCSASRRGALACADQVLRSLRPSERIALRTDIIRRLGARNDQRGTKQAHQLLALATGKPEHPVESALLLTVVDGGFPIPTCQHEVVNHGWPPRRLSLAWPSAKVGLVYGHDPNHDPADEQSDEADLRQFGWRIVHASWPDLRDPTALVIRLRAAFKANAATPAQAAVVPVAISPTAMSAAVSAAGSNAMSDAMSNAVPTARPSGDRKWD